MNVLMVLSQVEVTGAEVYAATISDKLIEKGHKVIIVSDHLKVKTKAGYYPLPLNRRRLYLQIKHLFRLIQLIRREKISIIHTHSRISSKLSFIASRLCRIPMVYTAHGHHHVHLSKKLFPAYGDYALAICENVMEQVVHDLKWDRKRMEILRNGINTSVFTPDSKNGLNKKPTVSFIGRLSGPKGDTAYKILEEICIRNPIDKNVGIKVVGGSEIPERFLKFSERVKLSGYVGNIRDQISSSSLVIGSGRVAIESIMMGKPTIAFGEAAYEGLVTKANYHSALKSNFGDISETGTRDVTRLENDISKGLAQGKCEESVREFVLAEFDLDAVSDRVDFLYQSICSRKIYEIPILLYHRVITDSSQAGQHGTYITLQHLESHFKYLKKNNYTPITFEELSLAGRFDKSKKYVILTFDDGYADNYSLLLPLLKKYNYKAVVFLVTGKKGNTWDISVEKRVFPLLTPDQVREMSNYGIEFGAHTVNHVDLVKVSREQAKTEIFDSKSHLEAILGKKVNSFAYPYGSVNHEIVQMTKNAGYSYGISTTSGPLALHEDLYNIRRIIVHPDTNLNRFRRKVTGAYLYRKNKNIPAFPISKEQNGFSTELSVANA